MDLLVLGLGYVGLANAISFSSLGYDVTGLEPDEKKVESIKYGKVPVKEPGMDEALKEHPFKVVSSYEDIKERRYDAAIIAVPTPMGRRQEANLSYLKDAIASLNNNEIDVPFVVLRSTVPPKTYEVVKKLFGEREVEVISNPEFLSQGSALHDEMNPHRIIVGAASEKAFAFAKKLYQPLINKGVKYLEMDNVSAELAKYASNDFLAMKISFINEMSWLTEKLGGDVRMVAKAMGADPRIGEAMLEAGLGYGGSCFPKDGPALIAEAEKHQLTLPLEMSTTLVNDLQRRFFFEKIKRVLREKRAKSIAILGLSFKGGTADVRSSISLYFENRLSTIKRLETRYYDPLPEARDQFASLNHKSLVVGDLEQALKGVDAILLLNDAPEWKKIDEVYLLEQMKGRLIFDGRNVLEKKDFPSFDYYGIGY